MFVAHLISEGDSKKNCAQFHNFCLVCFEIKWALKCRLWNIRICTILLVLIKIQLKMHFTSWLMRKAICFVGVEKFKSTRKLDFFANLFILIIHFWLVEQHWAGDWKSSKKRKQHRSDRLMLLKSPSRKDLGSCLKRAFHRFPYFLGGRTYDVCLSTIPSSNLKIFKQRSGNEIYLFDEQA